MTKQKMFDEAKKLANQYLEAVYGIYWDDLPDTISLWDYLDDSMNPQQMQAAVIEACIDKMADSFDSSVEK